MAKPELSEQTKSTTSSLLSRGVEKTRSLVSKIFAGSESSVTNVSSSNNPEILGKIYKMMVKSEATKKLEIEEKQNYFKEEQKEKDNRNQEIIQALTGKKPKGSKQKKKTFTQEQKEQTKPSGKPGEPAKPSGAQAKPSGAQAKPQGTQAKPQAQAKPSGAQAKPQGTQAKPQAQAKPSGAQAKPQAQAKPSGAQAKPQAQAKPPSAQAKPPSAQVKPPAATPAVPAAPVIPPVAAAAAPAVSTAAKVVVGAALVTAGSAALASSRSTAGQIALHESTTSSGRSFGGNEYNAYNKGTIRKKDAKGVTKESIIPADKTIDFAKISIAEFLKRGNLPASDPQRLFAIGRYQIIPDTMRYLVKNLHLKNLESTFLTPEMQDYLFSEGLIKKKHKRVDDYLNGKPGVSRDDAILELAKEFASIGVPYDIKQGTIDRKNNIPKRDIKKGQSMYPGANKAANSPEEIGRALDIDRERNLKSAPNPPANVPSSNNSGQTINDKSVSAADSKKEINAQKQKSITTNNVSSDSKDTTQKNVNKEDDRNPLIKKGTK